MRFVVASSSLHTKTFLTTTTIIREIFYDGKSKKQITREGDEGARGKCIEAVSIFKTGIKPQWEEPVNKTGGGWYVVFEREARESHFHHSLTHNTLTYH